MKRSIAVLLMMVFCLVCRISALAEDEVWTDEVLDIGGHTITVHAIVDDTLPENLQQIKLTGCVMTKRALYQSLSDYFLLHPDFKQKNSQVNQNTYISMWASGYNGIAGYDSRLSTNCEVERLFPIENPELCRLYEDCVAFLESWGIKATEQAGYICRQEQYGENYTIVLIPYQIEGLSTEYKNQIVSRDSLQQSNKTDQHIMDYPWADFVFDERGQLVKIEMAVLEVASAKVLSGEPVAWEKAAENALKAVIASCIDIKQLLEEQSFYDEEQFWQDYRVQLSRVLPMWMQNWFNVCLPGWCIQYQLYDASTGEFLYAMSFCADMLTGEVKVYAGNE